MGTRSNKKIQEKNEIVLWKITAFFALILAIAGIIMSIVSLAQKDNDTKYVIPDTTAIIPFQSAILNTKLYGCASNAPNATIMLEIKGNDVTIQFPYYYGNCSSNSPPSFISTDPIPLEYAQVNASLPSQVLYAPQVFMQVSCDAGTKLALATIDVDRKLYLYYDFNGVTPWNGNCYIFPFTFEYFKNTTYEKTIP